MVVQRLIQWCGLLTISMILLGCGPSDGPELVPVKGVVSYKGKPIEKINVMFVPVDGRGHIAEATTDAEGKFKLQTREPGDGAVVGNYKVSFKFVSDIIPDMPGFVGGVKPEPSPIPEKYADENKSGHTATVADDSSKNDFKFDLN